MRLHFATLTKRKPVPTSAPWISYRGKKSTLLTLAIVHLILWIHFKSISHHSVPFLPFIKPLTLTAALNWKTLWASVCLEMWNKTQTMSSMALHNWHLPSHIYQLSLCSSPNLFNHSQVWLIPNSAWTYPSSTIFFPKALHEVFHWILHGLVLQQV